ANRTFAYHKQFRLPQLCWVICHKRQICLYRGRTLLGNFQKRATYRVPCKTDYVEGDQFAQGVGQLGQLVAAQVERGQGGQAAQPVGQLGQLVITQVELEEGGQAAQ